MSKPQVPQHTTTAQGEVLLAKYLTDSIRSIEQAIRKAAPSGAPVPRSLSAPRLEPRPDGRRAATEALLPRKLPVSYAPAAAAAAAAAAVHSTRRSGEDFSFYRHSPGAGDVGGVGGSRSAAAAVVVTQARLLQGPGPTVTSAPASRLGHGSGGGGAATTAAATAGGSSPGAGAPLLRPSGGGGAAAASLPPRPTVVRTAHAAAAQQQQQPREPATAAAAAPLAAAAQQRYPHPAADRSPHPFAAPHPFTQPSPHPYPQPHSQLQPHPQHRPEQLGHRPEPLRLPAGAPHLASPAPVPSPAAAAAALSPRAFTRGAAGGGGGGGGPSPRGGGDARSYASLRLPRTPGAPSDVGSSHSSWWRWRPVTDASYPLTAITDRYAQSMTPSEVVKWNEKVAKLEAQIMAEKEARRHYEEQLKRLQGPGGDAPGGAGVAEQAAAMAAAVAAGRGTRAAPAAIAVGGGGGRAAAGAAPFR